MRKFLVKIRIPLLIILAAEIVLLAFFIFKYNQNVNQNKIFSTEKPTQTEAPVNTEAPTPMPTETPEPEFCGKPELKIEGDAADLIKTEVQGDRILAFYPYDFDETKIKNLKISISGENIFQTEIAKTTEISAWENIIAKVTDTQGLTKRYTVSFQPEARNLPVVALYTEAQVTSKTEYVGGTLYTNGEDGLNGAELQVKGRGNASWHSTEKKSYRLKLDTKAPVLGLKANRDFVLVSNYFDKSLIRNVTAHEMAKTLENLYYTPTHILVDFYLNGKYMGVYTIADKIETANSKVDINEEANTDTDRGFLVEIGWDYESVNVYGRDYFDLDSKLIVRIFMKDPKPTTVNSQDLNYARKYLNKTDKAIQNLDNYEEYIDVDNFVDWFILAELTNNTEMAFHRSTYMYKAAGGKLCLGPVWDFDMAFGNHNGDISNYDGWATAEAVYSYVGDTWMTYLIKDETFMAKVKARWNEKKQVLLDTAYKTIEENYEKLEPSAKLNFTVWDILNQRVGEGRVDYKKYNTHELQVTYVKDFITKRAEWIDNKLNQ